MGTCLVLAAHPNPRTERGPSYRRDSQMSLKGSSRGGRPFPPPPPALLGSGAGDSVCPAVRTSEEAGSGWAASPRGFCGGRGLSQAVGLPRATGAFGFSCVYLRELLCVSSVVPGASSLMASLFSRFSGAPAAGFAAAVFQSSPPWSPRRSFLPPSLSFKPASFRRRR